jgi:hypothetical protein
MIEEERWKKNPQYLVLEYPAEEDVTHRRGDWVKGDGIWWTIVDDPEISANPYGDSVFYRYKVIAI